MPFGYVPPRMGRQVSGMTGRRPDYRRMMREYIESYIPGLRAYQAAEREKGLRERELATQEEGLTLAEEGQELSAEQAEEAMKQGELATQIAGGSLGVQGALAIKEFLPGAAGTADLARTGLTPAAGGAAPGPAVSAGPGFAGYAGAGATVAGIEALHQAYTKRKALELAEREVGGKKEWKTGELALTRGAQGAAIGSVVPGIGTGVGAATGAAVGVLESEAPRIRREFYRSRRSDIPAVRHGARGAQFGAGYGMFAGGVPGVIPGIATGAGVGLVGGQTESVAREAKRIADKLQADKVAAEAKRTAGKAADEARRVRDKAKREARRIRDKIKDWGDKLGF